MLSIKLVFKALLFYLLLFGFLWLLASCESPSDPTLEPELSVPSAAKDKRNVPKNTGQPDPGPSEYDIAVLDLWHLRPFTLAGRDYQPYDIPGHTNVQGGEYYIYRPDPEYITPWVEYVRFNRVFANEYTTSYHQDTHVYNGGSLSLEDVGDFYYLEQKIDHINNDYWIWYNNTPRDPNFCGPYYYDDGSGPGSQGLTNQERLREGRIHFRNSSGAIIDFQFYLMAESCDGRGQGEVLFSQHTRKADGYSLETFYGFAFLLDHFPPIAFTTSRGDVESLWTKNVKVKIKVQATRNNEGGPTTSRVERIISAADLHDLIINEGSLYYEARGSAFDLEIRQYYVGD